MKGLVFLPAYEQAFLDDCEEILPAIVDRRAITRLALAFCTNMRRAAIASLLRTGRSGVFQRRLQRAGSAYLYFLSGPLGPSSRTSDAKPYLDAVAAGDFATADEIARRTPQVWSEADEYEEDFLFFEFVMRHAATETSVANATAILDRWEKCLGDTEDLRLPVCRAMVGDDPDAFDQALTDYLDAVEADQRKRLPLLDPEAAATEASVSVEGLALRQLAARRGVATAAEHPQLPVPLVKSTTDWPPESFRSID